MGSREITDFRWIKWISDLHELRECCLLAAVGLWKQRMPFLQASVHPELPLLGLSFSGVAVLSSPAPLTEAHCHRLVTSAQTGRARRDLGAQEWHTPSGRWWQPEDGDCRVWGQAQPLPCLPQQVLMSSGPAVLHCVHGSVDVLCASILFTFLPISVQFDCGQSLVDRREGRGGLIQSFYLALCLIKTTTNGTV